MALSFVALSGLLGVLVFKIVSSWFHNFRLKRHMFPSPPGIPFLGNALQVPHGEPWLAFEQWKEKYGPVFSLNMAGKHFVVLNTAKAAIDLIDHRSSIYSDRPRMIVSAEILAKGLNIVLLRYGDLWRKMRRAMHDSLHIQHVQVYRPRQEWEAMTLTARLLADPANWDRHLKQAAASLALLIAYGRQLTGEDSYSMVERIDYIVHELATAASPANATWVELFPSLLYLPEALATWRRRDRERANGFTATFKELLESVRERAGAGSVSGCVAGDVIETKDKYGLDDEQSAWLAGIVFAAGSETTSDALLVFVLAMVLYPDVFKRAQAEIDDVVGHERMPTFEDQSSLPYVDAIIKEVLRWRPVIPLGVPRRCMQDDWYDGHFIPAGATIIANAWAMSRDEEYFPNPDEFIPERHMEDDEHHGHLLPELAFGFGRRICPGKHFAYQNLYILIASMIWGFDIAKAKDEEGNEVTPSRTACVDEGIAVRPAMFPCQISPRRAGIDDIVQRAITQS